MKPPGPLINSLPVDVYGRRSRGQHNSRTSLSCPSGDNIVGWHLYGCRLGRLVGSGLEINAAAAQENNKPHASTLRSSPDGPSGQSYTERRKTAFEAGACRLLSRSTPVMVGEATANAPDDRLPIVQLPLGILDFTWRLCRPSNYKESALLNQIEGSFKWSCRSSG